MTNADYSPELRATLNRLFSLQTFGIKLGLEPVTELLDQFGNPHHRFPCIHVAGTNGKGSVCAMVASVLQSAGLRVGLYSSPHLVRFQERIRMNGIPMPVEHLARYTTQMMPAIERLGSTFFEGTTAMAFRYFAEQEVDVAVIETGMGGRLDATNVVAPLATAITSISFDHTKHLGETLEAIAFEKAGIIKGGAPAVVGRVAPRLRALFQKRAEEVGAPVLFVDDFCRGLFHDLTFNATVASFLLSGRELPRLQIGLVGRHQIENARVALGVIEQLKERFGIDTRAIQEGLAQIAANTGISGRFQSIRETPRTVIDVAHNPDGAAVLADTLATLNHGARNVRFVVGAVQEKDVAGVMKSLGPLAQHLYAVRADSHRSLPADEIAHHAQSAGIPTTLAGSVADGIRLAEQERAEGEIVVICGSFYVVGEALQLQEQNGAMDPNATPQPTEATPKLPTAHQPSVGDKHPRKLKLTKLKKQPDPATAQAPQPQAIPAEPTPAKQKKKKAQPENDASPKTITVKDWQPSEQPRERLINKGAGSLSNVELLAILLRTGRVGEDVLQMSRRLLNLFKNITELSRRDVTELQSINGIGPTKAVTLAAAFELVRRVKSEAFTSRTTITSPADVARYIGPHLRDLQKEQFHVLILNTANQVVRREMVSEGNLNSSIVHPREVFRTAIIENAAAIIGIHNHPSGNPTPSREDINITRQLVDAGKIIGITFHDHVIIAGEEYVSLAEQGYV
ncbi:MAG: DNA repair protein RadC [Chlorobi bacterium]|nr:DNA repair protein RadC [Chlorobiota bacterium]MBX7216149.1 DNA repair protein RadC [Candidatus Kapabacteria bacterium]